MKKHLVLGLILAGFLSAGDCRAEWPEWMDRWLFNAEERTRRGSDSLAAKNYDQAAAAMDTAFRLAPDNPTAAFNAGTARLPLAPEEGRLLLDAAGQSDDSHLASRAHFNSGNSLMENGDLPGAIESFKQSLRRDPGFEDAKFNLELAQKRLQEQQQENQDQQNQDPNQDQQNQDQQNQDQQNQDSQDQNQDQQDQDQQDQENQDEQDQEQQNQDQQDSQNQDEQNQDEQNQDQQNQDSSQDQNEQESQDQNQQEGQNEQNPAGGQDQEESPLPQFQDLPDMSAEEAAAILEAIENLERDQRREEALAAAKANVGGKKDW